MRQAIKNLTIKDLLKSRDAVAEVLDFVTIAGILILSFSIIAVAGYPVLESAQETRYTENTRLSFVVLAENINKIALNRALSQSVEIKMYGGTLSIAGSSSIKINATWYNESKGSTEEITLYNQQMRSIENYVGDNVVAYESTGVWVKYPNGVVLNAYRPLVTNQSSMLVIPVVSIAGTSSISGEGISRVRAIGYSDVIPYSNVSNVTIAINSSYINGWKNYYKSMSWDICSTNECTVRLNKSNIDVNILRSQMDVVII